MNKTKKKKIALVHDYLREYGGAERVLEVLHEMYPDAPVYVAFVDKKSLGQHRKRFADWNLKTTWLAKIPFIKKLYSPLRVLAPKAFEDLDLSKYDVVISSSNAYFAKAVKVPNGKHFCYCHTPPRVLYGYSAMSDWKSKPVLRMAGTLINHFMRPMDFKMAQKVDQFIANSQEVAGRIQKFYRRDSVVINPPVLVPNENEMKAVGGLMPLKNRGYYLYVNRLALAKHPELAVQVCSKLKLPLKVVGTGKMLDDLKSMAGETVEFLGSVADKELNELYAGAKALLYPVEYEDFGMVPVEAMSWGTPVVAHNSGGPKETIVDGETGVLFEELSVGGLEKALKRLDKLVEGGKISPQKINKHARQFGKREFVGRIREAVE